MGCGASTRQQLHVSDVPEIDVQKVACGGTLPEPSKANSAHHVAVVDVGPKPNAQAEPVKDDEAPKGKGTAADALTVSEKKPVLAKAEPSEVTLVEKLEQDPNTKAPDPGFEIAVSPCVSLAPDPQAQAKFGSSPSHSRLSTESKEAFVRHLSRQASKVQQQLPQQGLAILRNPSKASLNDGSNLMGHFRRIFDTLQGAADQDKGIGGVTPCKLEAALEAFAQALPGDVAPRIAFVVSHIFDQIDHSGAGLITWGDFEAWLYTLDTHAADSEEALCELFELCDADGTGKISAQELMDVILLMSELGGGGDDPSKALSAETAELIVRDLDSAGNGGIGLMEFIEVIHAASAQHQTRTLTRSFLNLNDDRPHLVLNFDVNNTVVMMDSATGADTTKLLAQVVANTAWGTVEKNIDGVNSWILRHTELSVLAPKPGLQTYKEFVDMSNPMIVDADGIVRKEEDLRVKRARRALAWSFTDPGHPGESLHPKLLELRDALLLPEQVRGSDKAIRAGLTNETVQLLPSFLWCLRELKRSGRSFTLLFRTFGHDLERIEKELNALCEGRHPLFPEDDPLVLDGSDGGPDYRMELGSKRRSGTFFRDAGSDLVALVMGTTEQPKKFEEFTDFYMNRKDVEQLIGPQAVSTKYAELSTECQTVGLRDFYPGWAAVGSQSHGGKPFFLDSLNDPSRHCIFFDDHIQPTNPHIVDPINAHHWPRRFRISQLFGVHLVQAQPLHSILNKDYFLQHIRDCEAAREAKLQRWELVQRLLGDLAGMQRILSALVRNSGSKAEAHASASAYHTFMEIPSVQRASGVNTFEEDECDDAALQLC